MNKADTKLRAYKFTHAHRRLTLLILLLFASLFVFNQEVYAQAGEITGTVYDGESGETLPSVNVVIEGAGPVQGASTDAEGTYTIPGVEPGTYTLRASFVGYREEVEEGVEVTAGEATVVDFVLTAEELGLDEVVVVGYGTQERQTVTGSITSVDVDELRQAPVANVSNALVGRVPGLKATQATGEPGQDAATLRIRGVSTLNSSGRNPLIVIDGVERDFSMMNDLDPDEIESINVLKDASATAVYGVRGANGVIIVNTKRGRAGEPQVSFSSNYGFTQMAVPVEALGSYDYALYRNEAIQMDDDPSYDHLLFDETDLWKFKNNRDYTPEEIDAMDLTEDQKSQLMESPALYYSSTDWFSEQFGNPGPQQRYNVNMSGGSDNVQYFTSVGYLSQDGNISNGDYGDANANSTYDRYNFRSNIDIDVIENLEISINVGGQISDFSGIVGQDGDITSQFSRYKNMTVAILQSAPYSGPGMVDGRLVTNYVSGSSPLEDKGGSGYSPTARVLTRGVMSSITSTLNTSTEISHSMDYLIQGLSVQGTFSYDNRYRKGRLESRSIPTYTASRDPDNPADILFFGGTTGPASIDDDFGNSKWRRFYLDASVNYNRGFGNHTVGGLALVNAQKTFDPGLRFNVPAGLMGVVGRVTYDYDERYLAEFNMGYNGSENFPDDSRFGFFPAVSAGWNISNEHFFPETNLITLLKVRGSYGEVGNDEIGGRRYLYLPSTWGYGSSPTEGYYFGETDGTSQSPFYEGAYESTVGNPNVTWERAKKYNVGLEINLFNYRLTFAGDYFREQRDNILWPLGTVPDLVGSDLPPANLGEVSNRGYEIEVGWRDQIGQFGYRLESSVSYARNRIEFMDEPLNPYPWMNQTGFSLGQYFGYHHDGFYNSAAEANNRPHSSVDGNRVQAGDLRYIDINGDGQLDIQDRAPIGHPNLPEYSFNFSLGVSYGGFDLSALVIGTANGSLPLANFGAFEDSPLAYPFMRGNSGAMRWQYEGRWTPEKAEQGIEPSFPRASMGLPFTQNGQGSSFWLQSSDFVRLKNVEISYTFNVSNWEGISMNSIRVYASGNNLYTFGDHVIDPEQQDAGAVARGYLYPLKSVYNLGINVQF